MKTLLTRRPVPRARMLGSAATKDGGGESASVSFLSLHHPRILLGHPPPPRGRVEARAGNEPSRSLKFHNYSEAGTTAFTTYRLSIVS